MKEMLKVASLSFSYPGVGTVIDEIDLTVNEGERVGIIGPNGAGKTTLFQCICGVLAAEKGEIYTGSKRILPGTFNPEVGYIFQNPDDQLFCLSVSEDIAFGPRNLGLSKKEVTRRVDEVMELTGTAPFRNRPPHHLSGGEKRMAAIAAVLALEPSLVIYDEPSSNLDMRTRRRLINFINEGPGTMLISSHDLEFILETCSRVIVIDQGRIAADGNAEEIMNRGDFMLDHGLERPHSLMHKFRDHKHQG